MTARRSLSSVRCRPGERTRTIAMEPRITPWGAVAFALAPFGLLLASLVGVRALIVNFRIKQMRAEGKNTFHGFRAAPYRPVLKDDAGHSYKYLFHRKRLPLGTVFDAVFEVDELLVFEPPPARTQTLNLEVPAAA